MKHNSQILGCAFFKVNNFDDQWRESEQTSLVCLNSTRIQSLSTSRDLLCPSTSLEGPDKLMVLGSPDHWLITLSFTWQHITGIWPPSFSWGSLVEKHWEKLLSQLKDAEEALLKDIGIYSVERHWVFRTGWLDERLAQHLSQPPTNTPARFMCLQNLYLQVLT